MAPTVPVFSIDTQAIEPNLRSGDINSWQRYKFAFDATAPATAAAFEHGKLVLRTVGGSGVQSNNREGWAIPGCQPWPYWRLRSRWASPPPADGIMEHGHMMNLCQMPDGKYRSFVVWHLIPGLLIAGVWETAAPLDGTGFANFQAPLKEQEPVLSASRTTNVVTAVVATGAQSRWRVGDPILIDLAVASYDTNSVISAVTDTTIVYPQVAANDAAGGVGTITLVGQNQPLTPNRNFSVTDAVRTGGLVTSAGLGFNSGLMAGDWLTVDLPDNTYDGRFIVASVNGFSNQAQWMQFGVGDDASGGAGLIGKLTPYFVETRLYPGGVLQARLWPDFGALGGLGSQGSGVLENAAPPWESVWSLTFDMTKIVGTTLPLDRPGIPALVYAHGSTNSWMVYDNISAQKIVV